MTGRYPFICFEGCDGVGKSTILSELRGQLEESGVPTVAVGQHCWLDLPTSRIIMNVRCGQEKYAPEQVAQAYFVDKVQHFRRSIAPALMSAAVIADRSILSDAVYQEVLYDIPAESTLARHRQEGTRFPDILVYVSTTVAEAYRRIQKRSKHLRHYERPADMVRIMEVYERVLRQLAEPGMRLVQFVNDRPNYAERLREIVVPVVLEAGRISSAA